MEDSKEAKFRAVQGSIDSTPEHHLLTRLYLREHLNEITVGADTGMRKGNQYNLRWSMLDFEHRLIHLPRTKPGPPHTVHAGGDRRIGTKMVHIDGTPVTRRVAADRVFSIRENREWFAKAKKEAGIPQDLVWHALSRHTTGSRLAQRGTNLKVIQEVLGHATITMAAKYSHLNKAHLSESMTALDRSNTA